MTRNPGLPIVRQPKGKGEHDVMTPQLREWLQRKQAKAA